jgi:hypothetical protein
MRKCNKLLYFLQWFRERIGFFLKHFNHYGERYYNAIAGLDGLKQRSVRKMWLKDFLVLSTLILFKVCHINLLLMSTHK